MIIVYDASHLVFTGVVNQTFTVVVNATGTVSWDSAGGTRPTWGVHVLFPTYNALGSVDLYPWLTGSIAPSTIQFTSTSYSVTTTGNGQNVQGDISITFAAALGDAKDDIQSGTFQVQNDFAPYTITGTLSGYLVPLGALLPPPAVPVPEPVTAWLLCLGLIGLAIRAGLLRRHTVRAKRVAAALELRQ